MLQPSLICFVNFLQLLYEIVCVRERRCHPDSPFHIWWLHPHVKFRKEDANYVLIIITNEAAEKCHKQLYSLSFRHYKSKNWIFHLMVYLRAQLKLAALSCAFKSK